MSEWRDPEWALDYLARADTFPHRAEGEGVLLDHVPENAHRVLDLGTGDGRLLALLKQGRPEIVGVGVDFSEAMLDEARKRFADDERVELVRHDLSEPLPALGRFDAQIRLQTPPSAAHKACSVHRNRPPISTRPRPG